MKRLICLIIALQMILVLGLCSPIATAETNKTAPKLHISLYQNGKYTNFTKKCVGVDKELKCYSKGMTDWNSSNTSVAKIELTKQTGKVKIHTGKPGETTITASRTIKGKTFSVSAKLYVISADVVIRNGFIYPGDTGFVGVTNVQPKSLEKYILDNLKFKTSNKKVVKIKKGIPIAVKPGKATITIGSLGVEFGKVKVGVSKPRHTTKTKK